MKRGFTLVEILVAVTIFVIAVTAVSSLFVQAIRGQRRNLAYQELLDQTSYVMEYMSRSIRMAMKDDIEIWGYSAKSCITGANKENYKFDVLTQCLIFRNYKDECQYFCLDETQKKLMTATSSNETPPASYTDLTSPELEVYSLGGIGTPWINLSGEEQGDDLQPLVEISLLVEGREESKIEIKTSVSQRNLDVDR